MPDSFPHQPVSSLHTTRPKRPVPVETSAPQPQSGVELSRGLPERLYAKYVLALSWLRHPLVLLMRVYWGSLFVTAGLGKLQHLDLYAQRFDKWGIHYEPRLNAMIAGSIECVCGSLLVLGLGARVITVPLIVTMIVAYCTAHADEVTNVYTFVTAPPFLHLLTCVIVLVFGPGLFSGDALLHRWLHRGRRQPVA